MQPIYLVLISHLVSFLLIALILSIATWRSIPGLSLWEILKAGFMWPVYGFMIVLIGMFSL